MNISISGHGPTDARLMLVADGASDNDVSAGYALTGDQERTLRRVVSGASHQLHFEEFWKTAYIKERINLKKPDLNRGLISQQYKEILVDEINEVRPNVVVPLSELSFEFLTG